MEPSLVAPPPSPSRLGYLGRFLLCVVLTIPIQFLGGMIAYFFTRPTAIHQLRFNALARPLALILMIIAFGLVARLLDKIPGSLLEVQGLGTKGNWLRNAVVGAGLGALLVALGVGCIVAFGVYAPVFAPNYLHFAVIIWICITAAALEEVATRGYPFQVLSLAIGVWPAAALLSLLFGALHLLNPHHSFLGFANTVLVGMLLAFMVIRTGTLWMAIGFHFAWNFTLGTLFGLPVSGVDIFLALVKARAEGHPLLTGGDYGLEASLTGTIVILLGFAVVHLAAPKNVPSRETPLAVSDSN